MTLSSSLSNILSNSKLGVTVRFEAHIPKIAGLTSAPNMIPNGTENMFATTEQAGCEIMPL